MTERWSRWISFKNDLGLCPCSAACSCWMSEGRLPSLRRSGTSEEAYFSSYLISSSKSVCLPATNQYFLMVPGLSKHSLVAYLFHCVFFCEVQAFLPIVREIFFSLLLFFFFFFCGDLGHTDYLYHRFHFTSCKLDIIGLIEKSSCFA